MHLSIRWKFILSIGFTLLVTYLGLLVWDYWWQRETATQEMQQLVSVVAQNLAERYNTPLERAESSADSIAGMVERQLPTSDSQLRNQLNNRPPTQQNVQIGVFFESQFASDSNLQRFYSLNGNQPGGQRGGGRRGGGPRGGEPPPQGRGDRSGRGESIAMGPILFQDDAPGRNGPPGPGSAPGGFEPPANPNQIAEAEALYQKVAETHRSVWIEPQPGRGFGGQSRAAYATPILNGDKVIGAVIAQVPLNAGNPGQEPRFFQGGRMGGRGNRGFAPPSEPASAPTTLPAVPMFSAIKESTVIGGDGKVISPPPTPGKTRESIIEWSKASGLPDLAEDLRNSLGGENTSVWFYRVQNAPDIVPNAVPGQSYWVAFAPIAATNWVATSAISESEFMDPIIQRLWHRALFLVSGLAILLAVTTIVSIRVSRPIERMASAVNQLAAGDLEARVRGVHSKDEIGQLAVAFNTMTGQLKSHISELTKATAARENVEAELRIARQIQTDLLPRTFPPFPDRREFDLHAVNLAAKRVAGDFFDFFFAPGDLLTVVIADVSGKGMPAALLMAVTRTIVRNLAMEGLSPAQIIERANAMLVQDLSDSMFVSLFLCQYDTHTGRVTYVNAGHPPPYRISADGTPTPFGDVTGAILGVNPNSADWTYSQCEDQLQPGETLLLYTDGVTEARAPDGSMFRASGLEQLLARFHDETVEGLCARIVDEVNRYQNGRPVDDVTLVALRRRA